MKITIRQTGGFAGRPVELAAVDTDRLDPGAAGELRKAVEESGFFGLPATVASTAIGADMLTYEVTVEDAGRRHAVAFVDDESARTAPLRRLRDEVLRRR